MDDFIIYDSIKKSFGEKVVLRNINLKVKREEILVILGGSGSGKSVLLKTTIGLIKPDDGRMLIEGKDVTNFSEKEWLDIRKNISYLFQWGALFDSMNVFENIAFPLKEAKVEENEIIRRVKEVLKILNLENTENLYPSDLSGGMKKRVALARSIISYPKCVLYDEPTSGLDPITANQINHLIREMRRIYKITSVVVTHDINSMFEIADRIAFLYDGEIVFSGTVEEALSGDNLEVKRFIKGGKIDA